MQKDIDLKYELHAYVDGDLDDEGMARVENYLRNNPGAAAEVRAYLRQKDDLRNAAGQGLSEDEPLALRELGQVLAKQLKPGTLGSWRRAMSVAALFVLGWLSHTLYAPLAELPAFESEVVQAHLLTSSDISEVPPLSPQRVSKLFSRIGEIERLPDLRQFGFEPIGAQLMPSVAGVVLHVPYRDTNGQTVSYFLLHDDESEEMPRHVLHKNGVTMIYWQHDYSRYALAAPMAEDQVSKIASFLDSPAAMLH